MLRSSHKNLRWEEAKFLYCRRNGLNNITFEEFMDDYMYEISQIDEKEFEDTCQEVRKLSVQLRNDPNMEITEEYEALLCKFGSDEYKQYYRDKRLNKILDARDSERDN